MILESGRVIPNWILQLAFNLFDENTTMADLIKDVEGILEDELNVTDRSKLSVEDALQVLKKFNEILPDYEDMLYEFFEKHNLGHDEYDGDNDNGNDNDNSDEPEGPENNVPRKEPKTYRDPVRVRME